jgi:hypothetical protein
MWLFDENIKKFKNNFLNEEIIKNEEVLEKDNCDKNCEIYKENFEKKLDEKIEKNLKEFVVKIPKTAKKQDLVRLKQFLQEQEKWSIEIFIFLQWKKISTKIFLKEIWKLKEWIKLFWGI